VQVFDDEQQGCCVASAHSHASSASSVFRRCYCGVRVRGACAGRGSDNRAARSGHGVWEGQAGGQGGFRLAELVVRVSSRG
jgi:hypothetical protein